MTLVAESYQFSGDAVIIRGVGDMNNLSVYFFTTASTKNVIEMALPFALHKISYTKVYYVQSLNVSYNNICSPNEQIIYK